MKSLRFFLASILATALLLPAIAWSADSSKIRVLLVTGGHDFEQEPFYKLFKDNADITFQAVEHPKAHALLRPASAKQFDLIVCYDMWQDISEEARGDLLAWLNSGKGLLVMHHAIASYQKWPEYAKIIGAKYYLEKTTVNGVEKARSVYQHDVKIKVQVADTRHPVTRGLKDFTIHDETYNLFDVAADCHPLLTTEEPLSNKVIAWSKSYGPARVVYLQSGHDHYAYENPGFQQLVKQAIRWTAKRD
jgi:type 1 glutamine amidotransferase